MESASTNTFWKKNKANFLKGDVSYMFKIASRNSGVCARLLTGRARHLMLNARQKEVAPQLVFPPAGLPPVHSF